MVDVCLLSEPPCAHIKWPSNGTVALILDGVAVSNVARSIYEWSGGAAKTECLYAGTRWEPVSDFAPWIVWLEDESDPVLAAFVERGAAQEWGYILVTNYSPDALRGYLRQLIVIERVPGCEELIRIAHPEMARRVIGEGLITPGRDLPQELLSQVVSPNLVEGTWHIQEPHRTVDDLDRESAQTNIEALEAAFCAFNRRRDNLALWEMLDSSVREWLGGPAIIEDAFRKLDQIIEEAGSLGHVGPRHKFLYLLDRYRNDRLLPHT
ncbi:DUF4123 domain-containing protein [Marinobacter sp. SS5-14b]|uniref:DUF4123 domain-containing protein n=1 Tax=Marinobacter sp. SS5-14b TaxID=3050456 RepID=UPI0026DF828D|nr:DUF4123 domain-containing protein [Marinobacter sp. SS5-14b]